MGHNRLKHSRSKLQTRYRNFFQAFGAQASSNFKMRISVVTALAVFAGVTTAQVNADAICQTLDTLTANVNGLIGQAQSLSILNAPLALVGQGPLPVSPH